MDSYATYGARLPDTKMLRVMPWILLCCLGMLSVLLTVADALGGSDSTFTLTNSAPLICGVSLFLLLRSLAVPGALHLRFTNREDFIGKVVPALDRIGYRQSNATETGLDFGPKLGIRARMIGNQIILVDFVEPTLAIVSGPKGILTQLEKKLKA